ncbi:lipopolysaccharide biosynthesis protein [Chryseobacterium sp. POL2]|uniref:lipopolysaccharide biosynthesis protein n=1 Tax=Chryseobacterium sp. POL2 TaxID=2713414 RepID=UPI0013E12825|nr:oligosaccharide flippase family protein [Chryseobacterium sp. POL2]QIG89104.1 lipopolysaccharide biosynthesis protein [Chryseobacterium sp. POL2]
MSVVARQGIKYSIIGYLGTLLGIISSIFIFPHDMEFYGKLRFILPTAEMFIPIVVFGLSFSNVKFFLKTKEDGKHHNFLSLSLLGVVINFIIFCALYFLAATLFPNLKNSETWQMKNLIFPMILVLALSSIFNKYITNYKRIVVSNIFENLVPKLANLGAFIIFVYLCFSEKIAYAFFFGMFVLTLLGYAFYANKLEKIQPDFSTNYIKKDQFWKQIFFYSLFGFLGNIGNYLAVRIDNYMIGEFIDFEANGVYSTILAIIGIINVPQMGLFNISAPIINKSISEHNFEELDHFHKKTSLSLFFLGLSLYSCILVGFPYLTDLIKNGDLLKQAEPVVWILGSAFIFDLATGFNGHIISLSKYYRFNIVIMLILASLTIGLNFVFLKYTDLGIIGIAMATAISLSIFNSIKIIFNYQKFKVFPLSMPMLYALVLSFCAINIAILTPNFSNSLLNLFLKPSIVIAILLIGNHFMKIYPLDKYLNKNFFRSLTKFK